MSSTTTTRLLVPALAGLCILLVLVIAGNTNTAPKANAEAQKPVKDDIMVVPVQIARDSFGIAMVDTGNQTIWIYEINSRGGPTYTRMRLLAARSWRYDRLLQDLNNADPRPEQIKALLEGQKLEETSIKDIDILEIAEPNKARDSRQDVRKDDL